MNRSYYLDLAASGLRMPIGADLLLHEQPDPEAVRLDGRRLGQVLVATADRFRTPLAMALMDLALEKDLICSRLQLPESAHESFHFDAAPTPEMRARILNSGTLTPRFQASLDALSFVARHSSLTPIGKCIGPFSLATKLLADPITPVYMAGSGGTAADDPEVAAWEAVLEMATRICLDNVAAQARAGAVAVVVAEPAASAAYISPHQLAAGSDIYQRYVIGLNARLAARIRELGMDLMFHCCGELSADMLRQLATLDPAILSLGSSRKLWEDAAIVPKSTVLFGNLPTKRFYSDEAAPADQVVAMTQELLRRMRAVHHPFILGSECDVLSVRGSETILKKKVDLMLTCPA